MNAQKTINVDGKNYKLDELNAKARAQVANIQFVDEKIRQLSNELAVADTARLAYRNALKRELAKK